MTRVFSYLFDGSLDENETKFDRNPIIFLVFAMEIPWLELFQNPCRVWAWKTNKTWINDMEFSRNMVWIWTKLQGDPSFQNIWFNLILSFSLREIYIVILFISALKDISYFYFVLEIISNVHTLQFCILRRGNNHGFNLFSL